MGEFGSISIENVIATYGDMVYRIAFSITKNKSDADDVFQEVFLKYVQKVNTYTFKNEEHLKRWLIKVCVNQSKDTLTSSWSKHISLEDSSNEQDTTLLDSIPSGASLENETNMSLDIKNALDGIPAKYRTVIYLYYFENLSTKEIASAIGSTSAMVRVHLTRARKLLKDALGGEYNFE